ncbi:MAG: hypothetical protein IJ817_01930 [Clostridia bacterium]|nr:hypothetical protein [Clostridia bacterium]
MKSKSKLILAIAAFVIAIGAAVGITVGVMAAQNATVTTPINVGYTSHEVAATVSGTWKRATDANATNFETSAHETSITFTGAESEATGAFEGANTTLASNNQSIVFTFTFVNNGSGTFNAVLTLPTTQTNVTIAEVDGNDAAITNHTLAVAGNSSATYKITVSITNVALDASFAGTFTWNLANVA